ncbi:putative deoxyribonuclease YcfH [Paraliobacillus sp. PM-2]|uniref:TatD family hydrolase n=1 Tax=Paraliobacillus sp. PM-2 TaxID=1462524 RepID=UPI00061CCFF8|nr:TatD family hydrolase [Paraliobacillus sp. PM-2]CQR47957.1 putative deoxyribonuclease YcfH [Paraliobacillus sp. PM-2]
MNDQIIDAHIHFDWYNEEQQNQIIHDLEANHIEGLISACYNADSAHKLLYLQQQDKRIYPTLGYHPEQDLPSSEEMNRLETILKDKASNIVAIGEVGLPYYMRQKNPSLSYQPYVEVLSYFMDLAIQYSKPIFLHTIFEDAQTACDLLEKHNLSQAHFHWYKGDEKITQRIADNGYMISVTPDCLYEEQIQMIIKKYPLEQMMVETDGPWSFEGPFKGKMTHPKMIHDAVEQISIIKRLPLQEVYTQVYQNTISFYQINQFSQS